MYPEEVCTPMRQELTSAGFKELTSAEEVDSALKNQNGTTLVLINSIGLYSAIGTCFIAAV